MDTEITFKNIVGTKNLSELWEFKRNPELQPETTRYFLIKKALLPILDEEGNPTGDNEYISSIYCTGKLERTGEYIEEPMRLACTNFWVYSMNGPDFIEKEEMLEILMDR